MNIFKRIAPLFYSFVGEHPENDLVDTETCKVTDDCLLLIVQLWIKCCVIYYLSLKYIFLDVAGNSTFSPEHLHYIAKDYISSVLLVMH